jgi:hypothetical protein
VGGSVPSGVTNLIDRYGGALRSFAAEGEDEVEKEVADEVEKEGVDSNIPIEAGQKVTSTCLSRIVYMTIVK